MSAMPLVSLTGWGISLRMVVRHLNFFFPFSSDNLGGSLVTSLNSYSMNISHRSRSALYADMFAVSF